MAIESIDKVRVTEVSDVLGFDQESVGRQTTRPGVYLIFDNPSRSFLEGDYCKIGRAAGEARGLMGRLLQNLRWHLRPTEDCGRLATHYFQVLITESRTDAARLEALFQLWHGNYQGGRNIIEPKRIPKVKSEPDFFVVTP